MVIAGDSDFEDDYSASLKKYAREQGVVLPGFIKGQEIARIAVACPVFRTPLLARRAPDRTAEAMSYRLPEIVSDIPANLEVGLGQEFYFPLGDRRALARKLQEKYGRPLPANRVSHGKYDWNAIERTAPPAIT